MRDSRQTSQFFERIDLWFVLIVVVAIFMRVYRVGLYHIHIDELNLLFWSLQIARKGQWIWLSNNWIGWGSNAWLPVTHHSPLNNYVFALPYLISPNPVHVRAFAALIAAFAVAPVYWMMKRYFGLRAAVMTAILLAVSNGDFYWSRWIFHSFGRVFVAFWLVTGPLAFIENKRPYQIAHFLFLALAVQFHPSNILLLPVSGGMFLYAFFKHKAGRKRLLRGIVLSGVVALLSFVPWIYGTYFWDAEPLMDAPTRTDERDSISLNVYMSAYQDIVGGRSTWYERSHNLSHVSYPPLFLENIAIQVQPIMIVVCTIFLVVIASRQTPVQRTLIYYLVMASWLPLILTVIASPSTFREWYILAIMYSSFALLGLGLAILANWNRVGQVVSIGVVILLVVIHSWMNLANLRWLSEDSWTEPLRLPLATLRATIKDLVDERPADEGDVVIIIDELYGRYDKDFAYHQYLWTIAAEGFPVRIIGRNNAQGIPLSPSATSILFSGSVGSTIPLLTNDIGLFGYTVDGQGPIFQKALFNPAQMPAYNYRPIDSQRFDNGARMLGAYASSEPQAGAIWPVMLVWSVETSEQSRDYQFSLRLVDDADVRYSQQDLRSLDGGLWRTGDIVFSPLYMPIGEDYVAGTPLKMQVLMYELNTGYNAQALDDEGQQLGEWLYLTANE